MPDPVRFHFDPIGPWWCCPTSRWLRQLDDPDLVEDDWAAYSPEVQIARLEPEELARAHAGSAALHTSVAGRASSAEAS